MLLKLIVNKTGGFWGAKQRAIHSKNRIVRFFNKVVYAFYMESYNAYIPSKVKFLSEPILPHGIAGIFISSNAEIGKNCVIFHQVTIGSNSLPNSKKVGAPKIGDNVYIGVGAKIIGNVKIGDNVRIGANAVVFNDIPDNSVVVVQQSRIIEKENLDNRYHTRYDGKWGYWDEGKFIYEKDESLINTLNNSL